MTKWFYLFADKDSNIGCFIASNFYERKDIESFIKRNKITDVNTFSCESNVDFNLFANIVLQYFGFDSRRILEDA